MRDLTLSVELSTVSDLLIIDGDAIPWMIGWHHKDHRDVPVVEGALDRWMEEFLLLTGVNTYIGVLAPGDGECFRKELYKVAPYKGNRPSKEEWILFWGEVIRQRLIEEWGFITSPPELETDDVVAILSAASPGMKKYICSPDKDLMQVPGYHIDYRKVGEEGQGLARVEVSVQQAKYNWHRQILTGDTTDNILGIPGIGPAKADKILGSDPLMWDLNVRKAYNSHFGNYYGRIIFEETRNAITLAGSWWIYPPIVPLEKEVWERMSVSARRVKSSL